MNHLCRFLVVGTVLLSVAISAQERLSTPVAFTHVAVIDVVNGRATPDMMVIISDGRITAVSKQGASHPRRERGSLTPAASS